MNENTNLQENSPKEQEDNKNANFLSNFETHTGKFLFIPCIYLFIYKKNRENYRL